MESANDTHQPPRNYAMNKPCSIAAPLLVLALLASSGAGANENRDLTQQLAQNMSAEERAALREQLGNRMHESGTAEQSLTRDSAYDGKKRMENQQETRPERRGGRNEGYGRGRESRQGGGRGR
jgi:hypothetical protein